MIPLTNYDFQRYIYIYIVMGVINQRSISPQPATKPRSDQAIRTYHPAIDKTKIRFQISPGFSVKHVWFQIYHLVMTNIAMV